MKANYVSEEKKEKAAWKALPHRVKEAISCFIFRSAIKSNMAVLLFRCEKKGWHKEDMRKLFDDMVSLYQLTFFGRSISDTELIERYEKMLGVDFDIFDKIVEVVV